MMKHFLLFLTPTLMLLAGEKSAMPVYAALFGLAVVIILFFWGVYKAVKTQKLVYALALLPFILSLFWMFFI